MEPRRFAPSYFLFVCGKHQNQLSELDSSQYLPSAQPKPPNIHILKCFCLFWIIGASFSGDDAVALCDQSYDTMDTSVLPHYAPHSLSPRISTEQGLSGWSRIVYVFSWTLLRKCEAFVGLSNYKFRVAYIISFNSVEYYCPSSPSVDGVYKYYNTSTIKRLQRWNADLTFLTLYRYSFLPPF